MQKLQEIKTIEELKSFLEKHLRLNRDLEHNLHELVYSCDSDDNLFLDLSKLSKSEALTKIPNSNIDCECESFDLVLVEEDPNSYKAKNKGLLTIHFCVARSDDSILRIVIYMYNSQEKLISRTMLNLH